MQFNLRAVKYFTVSVHDQPGEAYRLLAQLADLGVNLMAFTGVPTGTMTTQLTLFPEEPALLVDEAARAGIHLLGPHDALLATGDDRLGALADIHKKLYDAGVNVYSSSGVTDGMGGFGYLLYIRPEHFSSALVALGL